MPDMIGELEVMSDREGAVVSGWVAADVLYLQCVEYLTGALGLRSAMRLEQHLVSESDVRLFVDCSGLDSYDLPARDALSRVLFSQRRRIAECLILARTRVVQLGFQAVAAMHGNGIITVTSSNAEFMERLDRAAPIAWRSLKNPRAWVPVNTSLLP